MNRDALAATGIGIIIGVFIAGVVLVGPSLGSIFPAVQLPKIELPTFSFSLGSKPGEVRQPEIGTPQAAGSFSIQSPLPDAIIPEKTVLLSGTAPANALIVVTSATEDDVMTADQNGTFSSEVSLSEGINRIHVTAYADPVQNGSVTVFHTEEQL